MPAIKEQIQKLVIESKTEEALETLIAWIKTRQSNELNEAILLRSRYEQAERDLGMNLISPEDAARVFSQINFSLLNLADNLEKKTVEIRAFPAGRRGWLIALSGALLILIFIIFVSQMLLPGRKFTDAAPRENTAAARDQANIDFPEGKEVSLTILGSTATYTFLSGKSDPYNPDNQKVTFKIRCFLKGRYAMNFWESDFRLIANDLPYAAQGGLNEVVEGDSFKDGEIYFLIPKELRKADVRIQFYDQYTVIPIAW